MRLKTNLQQMSQYYSSVNKPRLIKRYRFNFAYCVMFTDTTLTVNLPKPTHNNNYVYHPVYPTVVTIPIISNVMCQTNDTRIMAH